MPKLNFTDQDWERVEKDTLSWWAGELRRPLVYLTVTDPIPTNTFQPPLYSHWSNYSMDMPAEAILDRLETLIAATHYYGDAFPWWWLNFGPGIVAGRQSGLPVKSTCGNLTFRIWFPPRCLNVSSCLISARIAITWITVFIIWMAKDRYLIWICCSPSSGYAVFSGSQGMDNHKSGCLCSNIFVMGKAVPGIRHPRRRAHDCQELGGPGVLPGNPNRTKSGFQEPRFSEWISENPGRRRHFFMILAKQNPNKRISSNY